jgi:predicted site-specific integrase-resolvase
MGKPETNVARLCEELGISSQTLYRYVSPTGELRVDAQKTVRGY